MLTHPTPDGATPDGFTEPEPDHIPERGAAEQLRRAIEAAGMFDWEIDLAQQTLTGSAHAASVVDIPIHLTLAESWNMLHPDDVSTVAEAFEQAIAGAGEFRVEYRLANGPPSPDGWLYTAGVVIPGPDGLPGRVVGVTQDITERKRVETQLRQSEARQAFLLRFGDRVRELADPLAIMAAAAEMLGRQLGLGRVGYAEVEPAGAVVDIKVEWTDGSHPSAVGRMPITAFGEEAIAWYTTGRVRVIEDVEADPRPHVRGAAAAYLALETRAAVSVPLIKAGQVTALLYTSTPTPRSWLPAEIELVREVAERTWAEAERARAETDLRTSEERLRLAQEAGKIGVWDWDAATNHTSWSETMWRLYGLEPETADPVELWPRRLHPEDRARMRLATTEMLASTDVEFRDEFRIVHPDGEERWLEVVAQVRRDDIGRPLRMTGVNLDITDRKRAEGEREAFAAAAAHDLKTPLTSLKGHTQLLLRRVRRGQAVDISALEAGLGAIDAATGRMLALVEELMDAALLRAGRTLTLDRTPTDLTALTQAAVEEAQQGTSAHTVRLEATAPALVGEWDGVRLSRVLGNLLSNAIKYSPNGGGIVVRVDREDDATGAWAVVAVHDRGIGIPAADLPYLFERFRRGGNVVGRITGSGVGLAGAKQIIEQHGGTITVTSVESEGSTFAVRLPLSR